MKQFLLIIFLFCCRFLSAEILVEENVVIAEIDDESMKENVFWFDNDENNSIELFFHDKLMVSIFREGNYTDIVYRLRIHIPDIKEAESESGLDVYYDDIKIGGLPKTRKNTWIEIELDISKIKVKRNMDLILKPRGEDNLALSLPDSGKGPEIKIITFLEGPISPKEEELE